MKSSQICIILTILILGSATILAGQTLCFRTCSPDPHSPTYGGNVASQFQPRNARGTGRPTIAGIRAGTSTTILGSSSYTNAIPILHLPGRAGLDLDLTLYYNSAIWTFDPSNNSLTFNADRDWPSYGFRLDFGLLESNGGDYFLIEADGTKHSLPQNAGYNSTDSTYINLVPGSPNSTLTYKDGTQVIYESFPSTVGSQPGFLRPIRINDTNGNFMTITYVTGTDQQINTVTDTLGRVITFNYNGSDLLSSITSNNGTRIWATIAWSSYTLNYNFSAIVEDSPAKNTALNVLTGVTLPNSTQYTFGYGDWGVVSQITNLSNSSPAKTRSSQSYNFPSASSQLAAPPTYTQQTVFDGASSRNWTYSNAISNNLVSQTNVTDPGGAITTVNLYTATGDWKDELPSSIQTKDSGGHVLRQVDNTWTSDATTNANPRFSSILTTLSDTGQQSRTDFASYDTNGCVTDQKEYDFGLVFKREIATLYNNDYAGAHILNLPKQVFIKDASGANITRTDLAYGETVNTPPITGASNHNDSYSSSRANLVSVTHYTDPVGGTGAITRNFHYDSLGNMTTADLDCCNQKQWSFSILTQYAYPDSVISGPVGLQLTNSATYNFDTGTVATTTDENSRVTQFAYQPFNRIHTVTRPDTVVITYAYDDAAISPSVSISNSANSAVQKTVLDGLGRATQNQLLSGASVLTSSDVQFDDINRQIKSSNPYLPGTETPIWTTAQFDQLGRPTATTPPSGGMVQYQYSGNATIVTDPSGKMRRTADDDLGRLIEVDEPTGGPVMANYHATMQTDGNFVLSNSASTSVWSTGTGGTNAQSIFMQDDGNLVLYLFKWSAGVYAASSPGPFTPQSCSISSYLIAGQRINPNQCIVSPHGQYMLYMAPYGNLFIYDIAHGVGTWGTNTNSAGAYATMQTDGNFVVYSAGGVALWNSGTSGTFAERLDMEDDGRIIVYKSVWNSGTSDGQYNGTVIAHPSCDVGIGTGTTGVLGSGQCFVSPNGRFELLAQNDGNMVIYDRSVTPNALLWSTGTGVSPVDPSVAMRTLYTYDAADNLTTVSEGAQSRNYTYDGLGRMTRSVLPENGTTNFTYTDFGAANTRTDARGVITTYGYDGLHRLASVSYNVGATGVPATPSLGFTYGTSSASNNNGRLSTMTDGAGSEAYSYDAMGRTTQVSRIIGGVTYNIGYGYNSAGELNSLTYPSQRVVSPGYDAVGRMTQIASGGTNYLSSMNYNSAQLPAGFTYGNGVLASFGYNDHLQLASLAYTSGGNALLNLTYNYVDSNSHNNGQIQSITDSRGAAFSTSYTYDFLSRLQQAQTNDLTAANTWRLGWTYDRYGNRLTQTLTGGTISVGQPQLSVDPMTNHVSTTGFGYDANGSLTHDTAGSYTYDADNRMTQSVVGSVTASYAYDGHRWRVQKTASGTTTTYIYSSSKVIAEYVGGSLSKEYIYAGNKLLATIAAGVVTYHHPDHLSNRVETSASAATTRSFGQLPFGETWYETGTTDKWKFTSYERDSESGLNYAMHRYYSNSFGRFTSVDLVPGNPINPQTLNRYAYVANDPINFVDPQGLDIAGAIWRWLNGENDGNGSGGLWGLSPGGDALPEIKGGGPGGKKPTARAKQCVLKIAIGQAQGRPNDPTNLLPGEADFVKGVFGDAGIDVQFTSSSPDFVVGFTNIPPIIGIGGLTFDLLGYSPPDTNLALVDRAKTRTEWARNGAGLDNAVVEGRVMSHELGHKLLGPGHETAGIMRDGIDQGKGLFQLDLGGAYRFTKAQLDALRKACDAIRSQKH